MQKVSTSLYYGQYGPPPGHPPGGFLPSVSCRNKKNEHFFEKVVIFVFCKDPYTTAPLGSLRGSFGRHILCLLSYRVCEFHKFSKILFFCCFHIPLYSRATQVAPRTLPDAPRRCLPSPFRPKRPGGRPHSAENVVKFVVF